ncbi:MAG: hypothetical protein MUC28_01860 [Planctomycetes bacterium]|jgi:hypothetical protein|nr:hypothetical protein [Planctomycetota bacterium]
MVKLDDENLDRVRQDFVENSIKLDYELDELESAMETGEPVTQLLSARGDQIRRLFTSAFIKTRVISDSALADIRSSVVDLRAFNEAWNETVERMERLVKILNKMAGKP